MDFSVSLYSEPQVEDANNFIRSLGYKGYKGDRSIVGFAIERDNFISFLSTRCWFHKEGSQHFLSTSLNVIKYIYL